jgi:radical SAM-linked protein
MRLRLTHTKTGPLIYIGNLDLVTLWERAARRAQLPLSYSKGFHPQPKLQIAAPLPLGYSSRCEVMDMRLDEDRDAEEAVGALQAALPPGIQILRSETVAAELPPLPSMVLAVEYEVSLAGDAESQLEDRLERLLAAESLLRQRRGKEYDLRPLIEDLRLEHRDGVSAVLRMRLTARPGATGRPDEVLAALQVSLRGAHIERTAIVFQS